MRYLLGSNGKVSNAQQLFAVCRQTIFIRKTALNSHGILFSLIVSISRDLSRNHYLSHTQWEFHLLKCHPHKRRNERKTNIIDEPSRSEFCVREVVMSKMRGQRLMPLHPNHNWRLSHREKKNLSEPRAMNARWIHYNSNELIWCKITRCIRNQNTRTNQPTNERTNDRTHNAYSLLI